MGGDAVYTEVITVTVADDTQQSGAKVEARLKTLLNKLQAGSKLTVRMDASQATAGLSGVQRLLQTLARPVQVVARLVDQVTAPARALVTSLTSLARRGISIPINAVGMAGRFVSGAASVATGQMMGGPLGGALAGGLVAVGGPVGAGVAAGVAVLGAGVKAAADFGNALVNVQNNTNLSDADLKKMHDTVLRLGQDSGASFDQLTEGAKRAMNITQDWAAAQQIVTVAQQSAVSTGADVGMVTNVLANAMHEYGKDVGNVATVQANANHMMGVFHQAAAMSNMDLQQFADSSGRAIGIAANLGISVEEVGAGMSALTKHGFTPEGAQVQLVDLMTHAIVPTQKSLKAIVALSNKSGVDLVQDFTATGLSDKGLTGLFDDLSKAYRATGQSKAEATESSMKMIAALRGGLGLAALMGTAQQDYNKALREFSNEEKMNTLTADALARTQGTVGNQMARMGNVFQAAAVAAGERLLPALLPLIEQFGQTLPVALDRAGGFLNGVRDGWNALVRAFTGDAGALGVVSDLLTKTFGEGVGTIARPALQWLMDHMEGLRGGFERVGAILGNFGLALRKALGGDYAGMFQTLQATFGGLWSIVEPPLAKVRAALLDWIARTAPIVLAKLGAWNRAFVDWVAPLIPPLLAEVGKLATALGAWIRDTAAPVILRQLGVWKDQFLAWIAPLIPPLLAKAQELLGALGSWIRDTAAPVILMQLGAWKDQFVAWVVPLIPPLLAKLGLLAAQLGAWITDTAAPAILAQLGTWKDQFLVWLAPLPVQLLIELGKLSGYVASWILNVAGPAYVEALAEWTHAFLGWVGHAIDELPTTLANFVSAVVTWINGEGHTTIADAGRDAAGAFLQGFWDFLVTPQHGDPKNTDPVAAWLAPMVEAARRGWDAGAGGDDLHGTARSLASTYGMDPNIFERQINQESGFRTDATSRAGARGIAQFMPGTGLQAAGLIGVNPDQFWADPKLQLQGAAALMSQYLTQTGGDYARALGMYNAGPAGNQDNLETRAYVKAIMGYATGGAFTVGGSGAADSQLVAFRATPGETVTVSPPERSAGGGATFAPVFHIDASGAGPGAESMIRGVLEDATEQLWDQWTQRVRVTRRLHTAVTP